MKWLMHMAVAVYLNLEVNGNLMISFNENYNACFCSCGI